MTKEQTVTWKNVTSFGVGVCPYEVRKMHIELESKVIERYIKNLPTPGIVVKKISMFNRMSYENETDYDIYYKAKEALISLWSLPVNRQIEIMMKACEEA